MARDADLWVLFQKNDLYITLGCFESGMASRHACSDYDYLAVVGGMFQGVVSSLRTLFAT